MWIASDLQAEIEAVDDTDLTPLNYAACYGKEAVAAQLLQAGASFSAVIDNGRTPLHWAAWNSKYKTANLLLQANASHTAVNKYGRTPAQRAKQYSHGDLAVMLLEAEQAAALKCERILLVTIPHYTPRNFFKPSLWCCGLILICSRDRGWGRL